MQELCAISSNRKEQFKQMDKEEGEKSVVSLRTKGGF
jgi:hypothetical protein